MYLGAAYCCTDVCLRWGMSVAQQCRCVLGRAQLSCGGRKTQQGAAAGTSGPACSARDGRTRFSAMHMTVMSGWALTALIASVLVGAALAEGPAATDPKPP